MIFTEAQMDFIKKHVSGIDFSRKLSDDDYILIEDKIGDILVYEEYDDPVDLSPSGKMCESILETLAK